MIEPKAPRPEFVPPGHEGFYRRSREPRSAETHRRLAALPDRTSVGDVAPPEADRPVIEPGPAEPVAAPEPVGSRGPVAAPEPVASREPVAAPEPVGTPPVASPEPVGTPPVASPEPVGIPPVASPEPVGTPPVPARDAAGLVKSSKAVSLYLRQLTLNSSFNWFSSTNNLYVMAICWDLSGKPPRVYPPQGTNDPTRLIVPLRPGESATFMGDGVQLWPSSQYVGGLYVHLIVMESEQDLRTIGEQIGKVHQAVEDSGLTTALAALAGLASGGSMAAVTAAASAMTEAVEQVLVANGDDRVAVFQGTYGAEFARETKNERYDQRGASIDVSFISSDP